MGAKEGGVEVEMSVGGLYNVYNALAATAACLALGLPQEAVLETLPEFSAAFGRQEAFEDRRPARRDAAGQEPGRPEPGAADAGAGPERKTVLFLLNDGIADGRDISWVWDADFEVARRSLRAAVCGGSRAEEMALRLKYAGWDEGTLEIEPGVDKALARAIERTEPGACLTVVPTYTAMLEARELLAKRAGRKPYWSR